MSCYLVRLTHNKKAVGIFVADDIEELQNLVDECTDPASCEYAEIPNGGILWHAPGARPLPLDVDWEAEQRPVLTVIGPPDVSELWLSAISSEQEFVPLIFERDEIANDR